MHIDTKYKFKNLSKIIFLTTPLVISHYLYVFNYYLAMSSLYLTIVYFHIFVSIALVLLVLVQKTTGNGLFTTSQSNPFMSGAEITQFVTKLTTTFVVLFFLNTLILAKISYKSTLSKKEVISSIVNENTIPTN